MVYLTTLEEWQEQSSLLIQARPATTRITTKYNIPNLDSPRYSLDKKRKRETEAEDKDAPVAPRVPRGTLTLKAYDPESGVTLKFRTDKSADVGRTIAGLGRAGRHMAALPVKEEGALQTSYEQDEAAAYDPAAADITADETAVETGTPQAEKSDAVKAAAPAASNETKPNTSSKKKKKGKK